MPYSFRQDLFEVDGEALCFDVSRCYDADDLKSIIEFGGGRIDNRGGPYTIAFLSMNSKSCTNFNPPRDFYTSDFILKCCIRNTILPLKTFLLNQSMFANDFNPNDVLLRKTTWKDAQQLLAHPAITDIRNFKNPPGCLKIDGVIPVIQIEPTNVSNGSVKNKRQIFRHEFSQNDRQKMIDFIVTNQNFNPSDPNYWRKMSEEFEVHTWQSLKGHFRNKIYPSITQYNLSNEVIGIIRTQMETKKRSYKTFDRSSHNNDEDDDQKYKDVKDSEENDDTLSLPAKRTARKTIVTIESSDDSSSGLDNASYINKRDKKRKKRSCKPEDLPTQGNQNQDECSHHNSSFEEEIPSQSHEEELSTEDGNGTHQSEELTTNNAYNNQDRYSDQSSVSISFSMKEAPSQEEETATENENGTCQPEEMSANINHNHNQCSNQSSRSSPNYMVEIPSLEKNLANETKSIKIMSVQWDCDELTVSDSFAQTEPVEILPLPNGWDYPTTFAAALQLMKSTMTSNKHDVENKNEKLKDLSTVDVMQTEGARLTGKSPSKLSKGSTNSPPEKSVRRSTRNSPLSRPKKTRSGWFF